MGHPQRVPVQSPRLQPGSRELLLAVVRACAPGPAPVLLPVTHVSRASLAASGRAGALPPRSRVSLLLAGVRSPRRTASSPRTRSTRTVCTLWTGPRPTPGCLPP